MSIPYLPNLRNIKQNIINDEKLNCSYALGKVFKWVTLARWNSNWEFNLLTHGVTRNNKYNNVNWSMKIFHLSFVKFIELTIDDMFINSLIAILIAAKHFVVGVMTLLNTLCIKWRCGGNAAIVLAATKAIKINIIDLIVIKQLMKKLFYDWNLSFFDNKRHG